MRPCVDTATMLLCYVLGIVTEFLVRQWVEEVSEEEDEER